MEPATLSAQARPNAEAVGSAACKLCVWVGTDLRPAREQIGYNGIGFNRISPGTDLPMPPWMEVLLNVIAYGGFIAIAIYHRAPSKNPPD